VRSTTAATKLALVFALAVVTDAACVTPEFEFSEGRADGGAPSSVIDAQPVATAVDCVEGKGDCDGDPSNGCETNTSSDEKNCAGCGKVCPSVNGTPYCASSTCQITCTDGFADCDGDRGNGCETNTNKDVLNCNGCGKTCDGKNGTPWCKDAKCGISDCPVGFGDCNGDPADGCEIDLTKDAGNCKTCGTACVAANGVAACVASSCKIDSCAKGYADCDASAPGGYTDGCETNTDTDLANCGKCGQACSIGNASAKCEAGSCKVKSCTVPFADCDGNGLDCESDTSSSQANCGGCQLKCGLLHASSTGCSSSQCAPVCDDGWGACGNAANGCDTSLDMPAHCGNCQTSCAGGTPFCIARTCKAHLDIVVVNASTNGSGTSSMTLHHALATSGGNHRLVLLAVSSLGNSASQAAPTSVVYGSAPMQLAHATWSQNQAWAGVYFIDDATLPAVPPVSGVDVLVLGGASQMQGHLAELKNVEQAIPFMATARPIDGDTGSYNNCSASVHPDDQLTLTIDGSYLFGVVGYFSSIVSTSSAVYPLQTKSTATPDPYANQLGVIGGYRGPLAAGAQHLGWNMSGCNKYGHAVVGIRPALTP
jgi:hypothetical protein